MRIVGVTGGVDTHADTHLAAAVDHNGGVLGIDSFLADRAGYEELLGWLVGFGEVEEIGVEGTESWGVGLTRFLHDEEIMVVEVDRPNRKKRRRVGKSDPTQESPCLTRGFSLSLRFQDHITLAPSPAWGPHQGLAMRWSTAASSRPSKRWP